MTGPAAALSGFAAGVAAVSVACWVLRGRISRWLRSRGDI